MRKYKSAFTMAEILIVLAIAGIITALSLGAVKIVTTSYTPLAYYAHKHITNAVGILMSGYNEHNGKLKFNGTGADLQNAFTYCKKTDGSTVTVLKNDTETDSSASSEVPECSERTAGGNEHTFCKAFSALMNKADDAKCSTFSAVDTSGTEPAFSSLSTPNFTLSNGMIFYLSAWQAPSAASKVSSVYGYRLIGVDINGKKKPNSLDKTKKSHPTDIAQFLVLDNGEVYPLGAAADNVKDGNKTYQYIKANVKGYHFNSNGPGGTVRLTPGTGTGQRDSAIVPEECKDKDGNYDFCNFGVTILQNDIRDMSDKKKAPSVFTYRQAFCTAKNVSSNKTYGYTNGANGDYCKGNDINTGKALNKNLLCPPSTYPACNAAATNSCSSSNIPYDQCKIEIIKPVFRYSL